MAFTVLNSGDVAGAEVAQLYLGFPATAGEPELQLKGFKKTRILKAGEREHVRLKLRRRDLSIWDSTSHAWLLVKGTFVVKVGSSSRDIRVEGTLVNDGPLDKLRDDSDTANTTDGRERSDISVNAALGGLVGVGLIGCVLLAFWLVMLKRCVVVSPYQQLRVPEAPVESSELGERGDGL